MKPDLLHDERIAARSDTARLLYYGLLGVVDDAGRANAAVTYLHAQIFWATPRPFAKVEAALMELAKVGLVLVYDAENGRYLEIIGWSDPSSVTHQRIDHFRHSTIPGPSENSSTHTSRAPAEALRRNKKKNREQEQEQEQEQIAPAEPDAEKPPTEAQVIRRVTDAFQDRFLKQTGSKPTWGGKEIKLLKPLVKQHGADEVIRRIGILFESPPDWIQPPFTIATLSSNFDRLALAVARRPPQASRHPNAPGGHFDVLDEIRAEERAKAGR